MEDQKSIIIKRRKKTVVVILFILLLSQIILFGLNSAFNIKGKIISVTLSSNQNSREAAIKKNWIGNFLIIEGKTVVSCQEPINHMRIERDVIMIDSSYAVNISCWGYKDYSARYVIIYNNIFSALEAYIFNDTIDINVDYTMIL